MTASPPPLVVFAIPTRDRPAGVAAVLDAIDAQQLDERVERRILVWDDASSAESRAALRSSRHWGRPDLELHESDVRERMRVKRRLDDLAIERTRGRAEAYVAHLDDDVVPAPGWLAAALRTLRTHGWSACGSVERVEDGWALSGQSRIETSTVRVDGVPVRAWTWRREYVSADDHEGATEVEFAGHRALVVRAAAVAAVPHDAGYAIGGEDLDWSLALRGAAHRIGIAHGARIEHRPAGEQDADGFRTRDAVVASWQRFNGRWGFVRDSAAGEAGMSRREWLRHFAHADGT